MFIPDKTKKTVRVLVQIKAGLVVRDDLTPLPKVREGTFADLTFPASSLVDNSEREELVEESSVELFPAHYSVFVGLNPKMKGKHRGLIKPSDLKIEPEAHAHERRNAGVKFVQIFVCKLGEVEPSTDNAHKLGSEIMFHHQFIFEEALVPCQQFQVITPINQLDFVQTAESALLVTFTSVKFRHLEASNGPAGIRVHFLNLLQ